MRNYIFLLIGILSLAFVSCSENYSNGERIGIITRFSQKGLVFKSWEGNLNITQTGMNTSGEPFLFSVDNSNENPALVAQIDSAANKGWKVKVVYHECYNKNMTGCRGETDYFIDKLIVLDKDFTNNFKFNQSQDKNVGRVVDTVYVVIVDKSRIKP